MMFTPTKADLAAILAAHAKWHRGESDGKRVILSSADLSSADLRCADLRRADLSGAILRSADLSGAILSCADLRSADLRCADLRCADLRRADLSFAILSGADLSFAILSGADLCRAILSGANLRCAAKNEKTILPHYKIAPEVGSFIAFKKLKNQVVATLEIPAEARRNSSLAGRKCRAEFAKVISLSDGSSEGYSERGGIYRVGEIVRPDSYDDDIRVECTNGIHFFMTLAEAQEW